MIFFWFFLVTFWTIFCHILTAYESVNRNISGEINNRKLRQVVLWYSCHNANLLYLSREHYTLTSWVVRRIMSLFTDALNKNNDNNNGNISRILKNSRDISIIIILKEFYIIKKGFSPQMFFLTQFLTKICVLCCWKWSGRFDNWSVCYLFIIIINIILLQSRQLQILLKMIK